MALSSDPVGPLEGDCGSPRTPPHAHILRWDQTSGLGSLVLNGFTLDIRTWEGSLSQCAALVDNGRGKAVKVPLSHYCCT